MSSVVSRSTASSGFLVDQVSIVLVARFHNPSLINPNFLRDNRIASPEWSVKETVTTPGFSQTQFDNGIGLTVDQNRCIVGEDVGKGFQDSYLAHGVAAAYVSTLPHVPYRTIGLNWRFHLPRNNPKPWLIRRFLKPGAWLKSDPPISGAEIRFETRFAGSTCFLKVAGGTASLPNEAEADIIILDAYFHYDGPFGQTEKLKDIIGGWRVCQDFLEKMSKRLLIGSLA
jgi:hypothetical protein